MKKEGKQRNWKENEPLGARNILVVCPNRRLQSDLGPLVSQHLPLTSVSELSYYPDESVLREEIGARAPFLCFLDVSSSADAALRLIPSLNALSPQTPVVALIASNDSDLILRCLRQGANEFLLAPLTSEQMQPVLDRLAQNGTSLLGGQGSAGSCTVGVVPVKGSCGASTVAVNLAWQLKREQSKRVLLADLDPLAGTISFLLKLKPNYTFVDALNRAGTIDSDIWKGLVCNVEGLDVLLSPESPVDAGGALSDPRPIVDFCRQAYDYVCIDLGGPFGPWSGAILSELDHILLVTTGELPALRAAQRALAHFDANNIDRTRVHLVINRHSPEVGLTPESIETALQTGIYQTLPSEYETVQQALVDGKPLGPGTPLSKSLRALARQLSGVTEEQEAAAAKKSSSWGSLLGGLFSRRK